MPVITNPITAQRAILGSKALVQQPHLGVIAVTGEDRLSWLHSLLSQNIKNLQPGQSTEALALDFHGHIENIIRLVDDGAQTWLIVDRSGAQTLLDWLRKMVFRGKVAIADLQDDYQVVASWSTPVASPVPALVWTDGWSQTAQGGHRYGQAPTEDWKLILNVFSNDGAKALAENSEIEWAPADALTALRIAAHRPDIDEVDEKSIPHELDFLASAVHLSKGCYRGQETVAKVHNLGHPPRRLVLLHLDGSTHIHPEVGDAVVLAEDFDKGADAAKGRITSVAQHHEMGPIALAVIGRNVAVDAPLVVFGDHEAVAASQEVIVPQDAGKVANLPRPGLLGRPRI
ncbi:MAG: hypothetical protein RJA35_991 [Actinomycetota bacterium]|jgi:folate-binding protein YgfZ